MKRFFEFETRSGSKGYVLYSEIAGWQPGTVFLKGGAWVPVGSNASRELEAHFGVASEEELETELFLPQWLAECRGTGNR